MSHTYYEIQNQPQAWEQTIASGEQQWRASAPALALTPATRLLFIGCGTSLYLAQAAAHSAQELTGLDARALPASEVFLSPASTLPRQAPAIAFVISRSGTTSEALLAADYLQQHAAGRIQVVGVTCRPASALAQRAAHVIALPQADERSVVMTQSYTTMLLALQLLAARMAGASDLLDELAALPGLLRQHLPAYEQTVRSIADDLQHRQVIYLGLGPNSGLAREATLKLKEMTQTPCEAYSPLEFRHGPISILEQGSLVVLLGALREQSYLPGLELDIKRSGARLLLLAPYPAQHADEWLALPEGLSDLARCLLYLPPLQLLAYYRALRLGLNPDQPRNLTQVVVIGQQAAQQ